MRRQWSVQEKWFQGGGKEEFKVFLLDNLENFTAVREKTRYYFCKYLYWYLEKRIDKVIRQEKQEPEFRDLYMFKGISRLRRKKMDRASMREYLFQTEISCGGIFEAFNYFYFEYTTIDWMEALLEYYGNIEKISEEQKKELAAILRRQDAAAAGLSDAEVIAATAEKLRTDGMEKMPCADF